MLILYYDIPGPIKPVYGSAYSASSSAELGIGDLVPLDFLFGAEDSIDCKDNILTTGVTGTYAVFCSMRADAGSYGDVALVCDGSVYMNSNMHVEDNSLNHSQMAIMDIDKDAPLYLEVQSGNVTMPEGTNANVTMFLIKDKT